MTSARLPCLSGALALATALAGCATAPHPTPAIAGIGTPVQVVAVRTLAAWSDQSARLVTRALGATGEPEGFELVLRLPDGAIRTIVQKQLNGLTAGQPARLLAGQVVKPGI